MDEEVDPNEFLQWFVLFTSSDEKREKFGNRIIEVFQTCIKECMDEVA